MAIEIGTVRHIAGLASLECSEEEILVLSRQLNEILLHIGKLDALKLQDIEPTSHVNEVSRAPREDRIEPSLPVSVALANAPESREGNFTVPRVIG